MSNKKILILEGGNNEEHDVSLVTSREIQKILNQNSFIESFEVKEATMSSALTPHATNHKELGDLETSFNYYKQSLSLKPHYADAHVNISQVLFLQNKYFFLNLL